MDQSEKGNRGSNNRNRDRRNRDGRQEPRFKDIDITAGGGRPARVTGRDTQTGQKVQGRVDIRNPKGEIILNQTNPPRQNETQNLENSKSRVGAELEKSKSRKVAKSQKVENCLSF